MSPHARCCWCDTLLVFLHQVWWCPTPACARRQLRFATYEERDGRVQRYHYCPTPSQTAWHEAVYDPAARRILCGGAAGPGKSKMLREALYLLARQIPGFHGLLIRKTFKDLDQSHLRFMPYEVRLRGGEYKSTDRIAVFQHQGCPESVIRAGHLETDLDVSNYLSAEYDVIAPDELVTFNRDVMLELFTRCRSTNTAFSALRGDLAHDYDGSLILAASNPGGRGSAWVKQFFIDHDPDPDEFPDYEAAHWKFLPAYLKDNPYVKYAGYAASLGALRETRKRQLLDGDWSVYEGQFFSDFRPSIHVRDLGWIDPNIRRFLSLDWGFNAPGVALWWAVLPDGHYHIEAEYKFNGDVGLKSTVKDVAIEIRRRCTELGLKKVPVCWTDPSCWQHTGQVGESIAETFSRWKIPVAKANNDRVNGWQRLHELLRLAPDGVPWLTIAPRCLYGLRTLPAQLQSATNPDDLETKGDDHWADAARYGSVSGIRSFQHTRKPVAEWGSVGWWRQARSPKPQGRLGAESLATRVH